MNTKTTLDITPSPRLLQVLGDIPLQPWQCLAELIDNSLDELLKLPDRTSENPLRIEIDVIDEGAKGTSLTVRDNGSGMSAEDLERSLRAGHSAKSRYGSLGLFGMGFNIATARLGNVTTVSTTVAGSTDRLQATIDFADIQKRESFSVPLERRDCPADETGTTVKVILKRDMADHFKRPGTHRTLMGQLGDVYSYLLRDGVPGINRDGYSSHIPAVLTFNGETITAKLPCVWSDQRHVTSYGQQIDAIQYVDRRLTSATACLDCGYWDRKNGPEFCEECGSRNIELRERRIWGWVGIQRYIDSSNFGVDFVRYGRKILKQDKSLFTYTDPDTLQTDAEYPIEMPANQGRIVGEIHLDHVPVTYQKNDFDRQSNDWQKAIEVIRGTGPLKPKGSREVNDSPLAKLYSAYRRNDPGLRYLTPGDGNKALHTKAREWAIQFEKGIPRLQDDTEWYNAAFRHQQIKDAVQNGGSGSTTGAAAGGDIGEQLLGPSPNGSAEKPRPPKPPVISESEKLEQARAHGTQRPDLSGTFKLSRGLGQWEINVVATREELKDDAGAVVPAIQGTIKGSSVEILVATEHQIFREYGRDVRDVALFHSAALIKDLSSSKVAVSTIYGDLVQEIDDLRVTTAAVLDRIERTLDHLRQSSLEIVASNADMYWSVLDASDKTAIEDAAAVALPTASLEDIVADGRFILFCRAESLGKLVDEAPLDFFDGAVFRASLRHRSVSARSRLVGQITRALEGVAAFQQDELLRQKHDVQLVQISLDFLDEQLADEELLA